MRGFRVWSNYWKRYAFDAELFLDGSLYAVFDDDDGVPHHENTDLILEFDTGLKDKNGKEIYEGDIVKLGEDSYEVLFDSYGQFCIENKKLHWTKDSFSFNSVDVWDIKRDELLVKVVGNIHMNPELLEEEA